MNKSRTTPYYPMGNGICERFNRTPLRCQEPDQKADWKQHTGPLVHAYNCMRQTSTGDPLYPLMFGRELSSPVELVFKTNLNEDKRVLIEFIENSRQKLDHSYQQQNRILKKEQLYNRKVRGAILNNGDRVLVKIVSYEEKQPNCTVGDRRKKSENVLIEDIDH